LWRETVEDRDEDQGQKKPQPVEDEAEIVADSAEHGVGVVAMTALEVIAAEMAVALQVSDHRLDG